MTFTIKLRGAAGGTIQHEYLCPVHGRFTADVSRDDVPDEMPCPLDDLHGVSAAEGCEVINCGYEPNVCGLTSPWSPSSIACKVALAGFSRGKAEPPPTPHALTTRDLADGMPMSEWRAKRAKLAEERRRKRIREVRG